PLFVYFNRVRNEILKEGKLKMGVAVHVEHLNSDDLRPLMANPPQGAKSFFIGDHLGGSGWEIQLPDGTMEHYYVDLPDTIAVQTWFEMPDAPTESAGTKIRDHSMTNLGQLYIDALRVLVRQAEDRFAR